MGSNGINSKTMRIRVKFAKTEPMRFTSHLDLYRAWERLLRRANVQLVFSQGYNPRPKLQLAAPLPLGITSCSEIIDFWLSEGPDDLEILTSELIQVQPPGIDIMTVKSVDPSAPPLQKKVTAAQYEVTLLEQSFELDQRIKSLLNSEAIIRQRRGKSYDLRPLIQELSIDSDDPNLIQMLLIAQEGSTGRPEEVLLALDIQPENTRIERTKIIYQF
ncbi:MAG: TIGR03936 family radical SAM-associated protein [Anaerolineales bacterium]|nr:TIGR03936 family radical SAM-associated protein [Anaerolineales bacterium]HUV29396.1 TIGR03936 family radical SAM-associated protein [Anaerolineales bacterium]